jgi:integrase
MSIYKRGGVYWYDFKFRGQRVQGSTQQGDRKVAFDKQSERRAELVQECRAREKKAKELGCPPADLIPCLYCGELFNRSVAIVTRHGQFCGKSHRDQWERDHVTVPTLREFESLFMDSVKTRKADKPGTIDFYQRKLQRLLDFTPLADTRLDQIDAGLIESYVQHRSKVVCCASVNRELATLRKALRLALKWNTIDRVPSFSLFSEDGRERTFVLSQADERNYLEFAPQPLHDLALLILDGGERVGEPRTAEWANVHLEPAPGAKFGYIYIPRGKSRRAKRNVPLTERVRAMLQARLTEQSGKSRWVFPSEDGAGPVSYSTVRDQHQVLREKLKLPAGFVIHSMRHTALTRLGESGAGAFEIMRVAGHSSVTVSQKYVHPSPESIERAFERLETMNTKARAALPAMTETRGQNVETTRLLPTVFTTVEEGEIDAPKEVV